MRDLGTSGPRGVRRAYEGDATRPLGGYLAALGGYAAGVGVLAGVAKLRGRHLPDRFGLGDTVLLSIATHKLSRLVAKDAVTTTPPSNCRPLWTTDRGHGDRGCGCGAVG